MYPQIYLGHKPATAQERRALRVLALDLRARIHTARIAEPTTLLLYFSVADESIEPIDLLLMRPATMIVAALRSYPGPIEAKIDGRWMNRSSGEMLLEANERSPLQHIRIQRDAVRAQLENAFTTQPNSVTTTRPFERTVGALICMPQMHPESRISLDISDHRQQLKVLGFDELTGLASMVRIGTHLNEDRIRAIANDVFACQLWHDGSRFLFELEPTHLQLRVLASNNRAEKILPLIEGENVIGRRRSAQQYEYRLTLTGDELVSGDHALITCDNDGRITVRDTSKNGTWITAPGGVEERVRNERAIVPGSLLRMGTLSMRLEFTED